MLFNNVAVHVYKELQICNVKVSWIYEIPKTQLQMISLNIYMNFIVN